MLNPLPALLPRLAPMAIFDILLVAVLIYQLLMIVRGTRAAQVLLGIVFLMGLYGLATMAGLEAFRSLLSGIVPYTAIALIVLFQSEIRRTLARLGRRRLIVGTFRRPEAADEILLALPRLSQSKTGALIVMERDIGLRTFIESGIPMDARISRDLLLAVFLREAPLHDGAVIVRKDRVAAAACFLPLSMNPALSLKLGTRHRAAIGITEETDCLSIVVSEETGFISVAAAGEIDQDLSIEQVEERITAHFGSSPPERRGASGFAGEGHQTDDLSRYEKAGRP